MDEAGVLLIDVEILSVLGEIESFSADSLHADSLFRMLEEDVFFKAADSVLDVGSILVDGFDQDNDP